MVPSVITNLRYRPSPFRGFEHVPLLLLVVSAHEQNQFAVPDEEGGVVAVLTMIVRQTEDVLLGVLVRCPLLVLHPGGYGELWTEVVGEDRLGHNNSTSSIKLVDWTSLPALVSVQVIHPGGGICCRRLISHNLAIIRYWIHSFLFLHTHHKLQYITLSL